MTSWLLILPILDKNFLCVGVCIAFCQPFDLLNHYWYISVFSRVLPRAFLCTIPSACLTWRPREVLGSLPSGIKLSMCFQTLPRLISLQGQEIGYSILHQCNVFLRFCFRCYHCSMTISRQVPSPHAVHPTILGRELWIFFFLYFQP